LVPNGKGTSQCFATAARRGTVSRVVTLRAFGNREQLRPLAWGDFELEAEAGISSCHSKREDYIAFIESAQRFLK
jgi:hypothetical protein